MCLSRNCCEHSIILVGVRCDIWNEQNKKTNNKILPKNPKRTGRFESVEWKSLPPAHTLAHSHCMYMHTHTHTTPNHWIFPEMGRTFVCMRMSDGDKCIAPDFVWAFRQCKCLSCVWFSSKQIFSIIQRIHVVCVCLLLGAKWTQEQRKYA